MSKSLNTREKAFVLSMCTALVVMTSNYAIMATFFPIYAAGKGMSPYSISIIFTAFDVGKLAASAVGGQIASRFGRRVVLIWGVLQVATFGCGIGVVPGK